MKFPVIVAITSMACKAFGAELSVDDRDLPRVPATEATNAVSTFQVRGGFRVELAASEPLIASPVAMAFDENGRLYVVEMRDYSERRDEKLGRVKLLEDADGDGRFETSTVFATNLPWPTAVICYDGGIFVGASPDILYLKDTNGDGIADVRKVVFTGFGSGTPKLNVQQLLNSFTWGIDNRIHGALGGNPSTVTNVAGASLSSSLSPQRGEGLRVRGGNVQRAPSEIQSASQSPPLTPALSPLKGEGERHSVLELRGRDFSFDPRTFDLRAESGGGQWGMSFDNEGNKFICSNSRHIAVVMYEDRYAGRNRFYSLPPPDANIAVDGPAAEVFRLSPDEPWRVLRTKWRVAGLVPGPVEGGGRASGYFTGAAGVTIYRGDAFPEGFRGDAFVADCGSNLIHRKKIRRNGLNFVAERAPDEQRKEFLASRDNWFRPVAMANGPDGTLYVVDMYREVVEHPWSLPEQLKSKLDLNSGNDRGRIYRIVPNNFTRREPPPLGDAGIAELVKLLAHPNGWHRDTASRLLVERKDTNANLLLRETIRGSTSGVARVHALHILQSLGALERNDVVQASRDSNALVRAHAIRSADSLVRSSTNSSDARTWLSALRTLANDSDIRVRYQLALVESDSVTLAQLIQRDVEEPWMRAAVLNGLSQGAADVFAALAGNTEFTERKGAVEFLREAARIAGASAPRERVTLGLRIVANSPSALTFAGAFAAGLEQRGATLAGIDPKLFAQLTAQARSVATNSTQPEARRIEAMELLSANNDSSSRAALVELLQPIVSVPLQTAAVIALSKPRNDAASNVIARWTQLAPATRSKAIALFVGRRATALALLQAVEQGTVQRTEFSAADIQRLTAHNDATVRNKARQVFVREASARSEVVKKFQPALELKGDTQRGYALYVQRCASCHRAGIEGFSVGPDLASVATSGKEKLLVSILDPNAEVAAAYVAYSVETKGGDSFLGVLAGDNPLAVLLKLPNGETSRHLRENVATMRASGQSLMPDGLEEGMSAQDMADLLEFVIQAKPGP